MSWKNAGTWAGMSLSGGMVHRRVSKLRHAISEYYGTASFARPYMYKYIHRSPAKALNYL